MKTATTLEFRNAVRLALDAVDSHPAGSWTEAPQYRFWEPKRYVCFRVGLANSATVAEIAEQILNMQGKTANARVGKTVKGYVRGTCVLA